MKSNVWIIDFLFATEWLMAQALQNYIAFFFPQQIREPLKRVSSSLISFWFRNMPMGNLTLTIKKAPLLSVHVIKIPSSSSLERKKVASSLSRH